MKFSWDIPLPVAEQRRHKAQMAMNDAETAYDDFSL